MAATFTIPRRFNGPRESGNGGYTGGVLAARLGGGPVEVSLRSPVPLDQPLELSESEDGALQALHGETLVAEARPLPRLEMEVPATVDPEQAHRAAECYRAPEDGLFSTCFVCGRAREDSFEVFAGQVEDRELVATPWTPPEWTADENGNVRPEFVWAALDCPTYFACHIEGELTLSMLVRQRTEVRAPVRAEKEQTIVAWPIAIEGRKRLAGAAVLAPDGEVLAVTEALLIEPRPVGRHDQ